ncbi:MAG: nuclear transport factor 2 family protein [Candidatus Sulfotelmatobacter sp.]
MRRMIQMIPVICTLAASIAAQDNTGSAAQSKVLALESAWNIAEEKSDVRALDLIFDNSMIYIDEDGMLLSKAQFLARIRNNRTQMQSLVTQTIAVRIFDGEMAVVVGSYRARGVEHNKPYLREGRFMDTWVLRGGAWVCVVAQATPLPR